MSSRSVDDFREVSDSGSHLKFQATARTTERTPGCEKVEDLAAKLGNANADREQNKRMVWFLFKMLTCDPSIVLYEPLNFCQEKRNNI